MTNDGGPKTEDGRRTAPPYGAGHSSFVIRHSSFLRPVSYTTFPLRRPVVPLTCPQFFPVTRYASRVASRCAEACQPGGEPRWIPAPRVGRLAMCATGPVPENCEPFLP